MIIYNYAIDALSFAFKSAWFPSDVFFPESVLVVKDLGVQYTRFGLCGIQATQFVEHHKVLDVVINEAVTMVILLICMLIHTH